MASYDPNAILGAQLETLATDIARDIAYKDAYDGKWIGIARTGADTVNSEVYWPLFSFTRYADFFSIQLEVDVTNGNFDMDTYETKIIDIGGTNSGVVTWAREVRICHGKVNSDRGYGNILYYTMSNNVVTVYIKSQNAPNVTQFCRLNKVVSSNNAVNFTLYSSTSQPTQPSSPTKFTEVLEGTLVKVNGYSSYNDIAAIVEAGGTPYYSYTENGRTIRLIYGGPGARTGGYSMYFYAVVSNIEVPTLYWIGFGTNWGSIRSMPIFSADKVVDSTDTSSWSYDDTNVPTRAAVEEKISDALSGSIGGFLWVTTVQGATNAISNPSFSFKNGDWFSVTDSGTITYYENNTHDVQYARTISVNANDDIYWTASGTLKVKPSNSLPIFSISTLSDWNTLTSPGLYQISVSGATNAPAAGTFSCLVSNINGSVRQFAMGPSDNFYRSKGSSTAWTQWRDVNDVDHAISADNATTAADYITSSSTTANIHTKFQSVDSAIYDISQYYKIRVVTTLPSSPSSDTIYFV